MSHTCTAPKNYVLPSSLGRLMSYSTFDEREIDLRRVKSAVGVSLGLAVWAFDADAGHKFEYPPGLAR